MNRRSSDYQPPAWTDENIGFPEPESGVDPKARAAFWQAVTLVYIAVIAGVFLWRYAT